jgi:hypothetical protein
MLELGGFFYPFGTARRVAASLQLKEDRLVLLRVEHTDWMFEVQELKVSSPLGGVPRTFGFPDGGKFECEDQPGIDAWLGKHGLRSGSGLVHRLERHWRSVALSLVVVAAALVFTIMYGIPASAGWLSKRIPASAGVQIGDEMEGVVRRLTGGQSKLAETRREEIQSVFEALVGNSRPAGLSPKLSFRRGGRLGANAMALPNGTIVITDELVELAEDPAAVTGVLAHELGHLHFRHGMQQAIRASSLPLVIALVTGDLASGSSLLGAIPISLISNGYSRAHEREADAFALERLNSQGVATEPLAELLQKLMALYGDAPGWLSTHPATGDRVSFLRREEERL